MGQPTTSGLRRAGLAFGACVLLASAFAATAGAASLDAFYGRWQGSGMSEGPNARFFDMTTRDLDVRIGPAKTGFFVEWITAIRDFRDTEPRRRYGRVTFEPSDRPGIYLARNSEHTITQGMSWASLVGDTLSVRVVLIGDDGAYVVQAYHRTVRGDDMDLTFRGDRDGQTVRAVTGRLKRVVR